jgi:predicted glycoside hydrolase/deacetylase ChbG (UPF0249 family)
MRLVLNADDLGLAPALTRRVLALRVRGFVSDASVLAAGRCFPEAAAGLFAAGIRSAGVHLCLVGGEIPVSPPASIPSLLASGGVFRRAWPAVLAALIAGRIRVAEVEREWEAQVARAAGAGLAVTHLDSHQHLHLHPALFPVAVRLAKRFRVPFVRAPRADDPASASAPAAGRLRARLLALLGARGRKALAEAGLSEPPRVLGLAEAGRMTQGRLERVLAGLPDGDYEAVVHPGDEDEATRARYAWGYAWREEADALESVAPGLAARGITAVDFAALAR